jgi:hypothetical protein
MNPKGPRLWLPAPGTKIRRALEELGPKAVPGVQLPGSFRPTLYLPRSAARKPTTELDFIVSYITHEEVVGRVATEDELLTVMGGVPTDYVMLICSRLAHIVSERPLDRQVQTDVSTQMAPPAFRDRVLALVREGRLFAHEEQLLGLMRLAILEGTDAEWKDEDERAFGEALGLAMLLFNDRHGTERPAGGSSREEIAGFALRSLAFYAHDIPRNVIARAEAYWFRLPDVLKDSPHCIDLAAEFEHATGADLGAYVAAIVGMYAHAEGVISRAPQEQFAGWLIDATPTGFFKNAGEPERMVKALDALVGDRAHFRGTFAGGNGPKYAGVVLTPFRLRPLYRIRDGRVLVISTRFMIEGLTNTIFWTIADHMTGVHGRNSGSRFRQFFGEIFERYVFELVRSCYDLPESQRAFSDQDGVPAKRGPDVAVFLAERNEFFEATVTRLKHAETVLAADLEAFDRDMNAIVVKKALEIGKAIQAVRDHVVAYPGFDSTAVRTRPALSIIVLQSPPPWFSYLMQRVYASMRSAGVADPPPEVLSIDELEMTLQPQDDDRLLRLVAEKRADADLRQLSFRNFLQATHRDDPLRLPPYLDACFEGLWDRAIAELGFTEEAKAAKDGSGP